MLRFHPLLLIIVAVAFSKQETSRMTARLTSTVPAPLLAEEIEDSSRLQGREFNDTIKVFNRKRNAHACMMSIVFLVLYPLGAISLHLPLPRFLGKIRIVPSVHIPIQILGLAMMIAAMGLGIDIARELDFLSGSIPVPTHIVIGLVATSMIILIQPAMGIIQHLHFRKTGRKSIYGYIHRWNGRVAIVLGMINQGLGFQLVGIGTVVHTHSLVRNFVILGVLGGIWFALVIWDCLKVAIRKKKTAADNGEGTKEGGVPDS
jgi:uncharacterized membrane protein (DUF485 family)